MHVTGLAPVYFGKKWLKKPPATQHKVEPEPSVVFFHDNKKYSVKGANRETYLGMIAEADGYASEAQISKATHLRNMARKFLESLVTQNTLKPSRAYR